MTFTDAKADADEQRRETEAAKAAEKARESQPLPDVDAQTALADVESARIARLQQAEALARGEVPEAQTPPPEQLEGIDTDVDTDSKTDSTPETRGTPPVEKPKPKEEGFWGSMKAGFGAVGAWLTTNFQKFTAWTSENMKDLGKWFRKTFGLKEPEDKKPESEPLLKVSELQKLVVRSWDEVKAISDKGQRILQAALFAYSTDMDCFTKDGNNCSGWCDSVFKMAGLSMYDESNRVYVGDYKKWTRHGTLQGLQLKPGDSIIYQNGNRYTGHHHEIVLAATGPDSTGNYEVTMVSQPSTKGEKGGNRKIRTKTVKAEDIKVVFRAH